MTRALIPTGVRAIVEAIGESATLSLVRVYPGTRIYVPVWSKMGERHPIARVIGLPLAVKLCEALGGTMLDLPTGRKMLDVERDKQINARLRHGKQTAGQVARAYGISERTVFAIAARSRNDEGGSE